VGTVKLRF